MSELEDKLSAILGNPQMMQQITALAQSMGGSAQEAPKPPQPAAPGASIDPALLQKFAGMASQGRVDNDQQALLTALSPYLSQSRVSKLERAMRAARIAGAASSFLGAGGLQSLGGR